MPTSDVADVPGGAEKVVTSVRLRRPDDWHVHLRDGAMLKSVVNYTARQFARAIVMPSLSPPITTPRPRRHIENGSWRLLSQAWSLSP